jgi:hypothetical protein
MLKKIVLKLLRGLGFRIERIPPSEDLLALEVMITAKNIIKKISPEFIILNGIFKGVRYPTLDITQAALTPKIVGSYEAQLHNILEKIINTPYSDIVDVGCAEGYYAVGFAYKMPKTIVHAFDINEKDLLFCRQMAELNNIRNITFSKLCSPETLVNFNFNSRGLVFCDCEGYELELFSSQVVQTLANKNVDVLVELHEVIKPGITSELLLRFKETHDITVLSTTSPRNLGWDGLEALSQEEKDFAVFEHRGGVNKSVFMEWAFLTVKCY